MSCARVPRLALAGLLGRVVAVAGPGAAPAAAAKQPRSACQKLAKSHKDPARSAKLFTAVLGDEESGRISACVLPRGRIRTPRVVGRRALARLGLRHRDGRLAYSSALRR